MAESLSSGPASPTRPEGAHHSEPARAVSADDLSAWVKAAKPGEQFVYFTGAWLVQGMAVVAAARRLSDEGEVILTQRRREDRRFDYLATRRRNVERVASCASVETRLPGTRIDEDLEALMAVLRRLANLGKPCGTNRELADMALLKDAESVRYRLGQLAAQGRIAVHNHADGDRTITIVSSGRSTARRGRG